MEFHKKCSSYWNLALSQLQYLATEALRKTGHPTLVYYTLKGPSAEDGINGSFLCVSWCSILTGLTGFSLSSIHKLPEGVFHPSCAWTIICSLEAQDKYLLNKFLILAKIVDIYGFFGYIIFNISLKISCSNFNEVNTWMLSQLQIKFI